MNENFGKYLRDLRKSKKLTLKELGQLTGMSHTYISQLERGIRGIKGVPSPEALKKLSGPLNVPHMELMHIAGHIDHPPAAIDFLGTDLERIKPYLPLLAEQNHIKQLETEYSPYFGGNFKITYDSLKELIYQENIQEKAIRLIQELMRRIKEVNKEREKQNKTDLLELLATSQPVYVKGKQLTPEDRLKVSGMLQVLFPEIEKRDPQ